MAYKRISPMPIVEGGTNAQSYTSDGVVYYDGTKLNSTSAGTAGQILLSQGGAGNPPIFGASSASGNMVISSVGRIISTGSQNLPLIGSDGTQFVGFVAYTSAFTIMPTAGTFNNLSVYLAVNTSAANTVITLSINNVLTSITVTVPASTTGVFQDLVHNASCNAGDLVGYMATNSSASAGYFFTTILFS
jgi:hypothetical protein